MNWPCLAAIDDHHCALLVAVIPNASRTEAVGLHDGSLRLRLAAPPIEGRANEALVAWVAAQLKLPRREVVLKQGAGGRRKRLVLGCPVDVAEAWLDGLGRPP